MGTPKYLQIKTALLEELESGKFEYGDKFYSNTELIDRFGASSITVIHAVNDLVSEGLLVRYQGKGTFVSRSRKKRSVLLSENEVFTGKDGVETVRVVALERREGDGRSDDVAARLGLADDEAYYDIERVRAFDGMAYQMHVSHIPARYIRPDVEPSYYESIYQRFKGDFGLHLSREASSEVLRVLKGAPARVAELLGLSPDDPCIYKTHLTKLEGDQVAEYTEMYKRWDYFEIQIDEQRR